MKEKKQKLSKLHTAKINENEIKHLEGIRKGICVGCIGPMKNSDWKLSDMKPRSS